MRQLKTNTNIPKLNEVLKRFNGVLHDTMGGNNTSDYVMGELIGTAMELSNHYNFNEPKMNTLVMLADEFAKKMEKEFIFAYEMNDIQNYISDVMKRGSFAFEELLKALAKVRVSELHGGTGLHIDKDGNLEHTSFSMISKYTLEFMDKIESELEVL